MDIKTLKGLTNNLEAFTAKEVDDLSFMSSNELDWYQRELENEDSDMSDWEHIRAFYTMKSHLILESERNSRILEDLEEF